MVVRMHAVSRLADVNPDAFYSSGESVQKEVPPR